MEWYHKLYVSDSIAGKNVNRINLKINQNAGTVSVYVITFSSNRENLLDIIPSWVLMQKAYPKKNLTVIGLAKGHEEALLLVKQIVEETYRNTGSVDIRSYLNEKRRLA